MTFAADIIIFLFEVLDFSMYSRDAGKAKLKNLLCIHLIKEKLCVK